LRRFVSAREGILRRMDTEIRGDTQEHQADSTLFPD
jgi:hypothetical protein